MRSHRILRRLLLMLVVGLALAQSVAGCTGGGGGASESAPTIGSSEQPPNVVSYSSEGLSIQAPQDFEEVAAAGSVGRTELQLRSEPDAGGLRAAAVVVVLDSSDATAEAESRNLLDVVRSVNGADDAEREQVTWRDRDAWLVRWEGPAQAGSDVVVRSQSLVADLAGGGLMTATVQGPPALFEEYRLDEALRTVRVEPG